MSILRQSAEEAAASLPALMAAAEKAAASVLHGEHTQRKTGAGEKFWQFREYRTGDRPQDIDWRQSAKTDQLYIRQKEWQTPQATIFWCSRVPGMDFSSAENILSKSEAAKILVLALSILITRAGDQVGLLDLPNTGRSESVLQRIGAALTETPKNSAPLPSIPTHTHPKNTRLVQAGDFLAPLEAIERAFKNLSARNKDGLVIQVLDPAEIELPFSGRVLFEDPADKQRLLINHVPSIRDAYRQRLREHIAGVESLSRQHHWLYILHRTDIPVKDTLAQIWALMHRHETGIRA